MSTLTIRFRRFLLGGTLREFLSDGFSEVRAEGRSTGHYVCVMGIEVVDRIVDAFDVLWWVILRIWG